MVGDLFGRNPAGPALVRAAESVADLAAEANAQHELGQAASERSVEHYRACGEALLKIKGQCGHGKYLKALAHYARFSRQSAAKYVRLAREWAKCKPGLHLTDALRLLSEPADDHGNGTLSETYLGPRYQPGGNAKPPTAGPRGRHKRKAWAVRKAADDTEMLAARLKLRYDTLHKAAGTLRERCGELLELLGGHARALPPAVRTKVRQLGKEVAGLAGEFDGLQGFGASLAELEDECRSNQRWCEPWEPREGWDAYKAKMQRRQAANGNGGE
jgi:hypothetical protein